MAALADEVDLHVSTQIYFEELADYPAEIEFAIFTVAPWRSGLSAVSLSYPTDKTL